MATIGKAQKQVLLEPRPYRWSRDEYYKLSGLDLFRGKRVELIEGEVIEMSPIHSSQMTGVTLAIDSLREAFGKGWVIRVQGPLSLGINSDPEPDVAVVAGKARDFKDAHPTTAALVIEVADSSLAYDRTVKTSLYAKYCIPDCWIVNLNKRQVEVHRRPIIDATAKYGYSYADKMIFTEQDVVAPLAKPKAKLAVAELLP